MMIDMRKLLTPWHGQILFMLLSCACGCGLPDYEKRMDVQRARIAEFDEYNLLLDDPIDIPVTPIKAGKPETQPAWPFPVFLRLPKGYVPGKEKPTSAKDFPRVRYKLEDAGMNIFVAAAMEVKKGEDPGKHMYLSSTFRTRIKAALADFCFKEYAIHVSLTERSKAQLEFAGLTPYPDTATTLAYDFAQYENLGGGSAKVPAPFTFELYVHENAGRQVAVVFQRAARLANMDGHKKMVEACLGTLDISAAAASKRLAFKSLR